MTLDDVFELLLNASGDDDRAFDAFEVARWPEGSLELLQSLGLLRQAGGSLIAPCPDCDGAHSEVVSSDSHGDERRYFISCPERMMVEVTAEMCVRWQPSHDGLAQAIARAANPSGSATTKVAGRLWRVGAVQVFGSKRQVVLARSMRRDDARSIAMQIGIGGRQIVLVADRPPDPRVWPGSVPVVISLADVASVNEHGLHLDHHALVTLVEDADKEAEARRLLPIEPKVKRELAAEMAQFVMSMDEERDMLCAAYLEFGSYRKAAAGLAARHDRPFTKDMISKAVNAVGGVKKLREMRDSASVGRSVASQSRDRGKKIEMYRK